MDDLDRKNIGRFTIAALILLAVFSISVVFGLNEPEAAEGVKSADAVKKTGEPVESIVALISVKGMIDDGLLKSIERRSEEAIAMGATYLIYEIDTYGGDLFAAFDISNYFLHEINDKAHTVAYVSKKAISAGAAATLAPWGSARPG